MNAKTLYFSTEIRFGKYKGKTLFYVYTNDQAYFQWFVTIWEGLINWKVAKAYDQLKMSQ